MRGPSKPRRRSPQPPDTACCTGTADLAKTSSAHYGCGPPTTCGGKPIGRGMAAPAAIATGLIVFLVAPVSGFIRLPSQSSWVCRTSETGQRCGSNFPNQVTEQTGGICRDGNCCKNVAAGPNNAFGEFCAADDGTNCNANLLEQYSFGKCSLQDKCGACSSNSNCHFDESENGGVWCQCLAPGVGNGITCDKDPCYGNPCSNGICSRNPDQPDDFSCKCYPGYTFSGDELGVLKGCVNACRTGICGEGAAHCLNGETTHMCLCKKGYTNQSVNGSDTCVRPDPCSVHPCGPPEAALACKTLSATTYDCECQGGFTKKTANSRPYCARGA